MIKQKGKIMLLALVGALLAVTAGCGKTQQAASEPAGDGSQKVKVAYVTYYVPYDYQNSQGKADGMEVAVIKEVAKRNPSWDIQMIPTSDEDLLVGLEAGKYDIGIKGIWKTPEREKKFLFPEHYSAASVVGLVFRTEDSGKIHSLEDFGKTGGRLVPISPQSAQYTVISDFNKNHPEEQIQMNAADTFQANDAYTWILEGRYDGYFDLEKLFQENVTSEKGPYHPFADRLSFVRYRAIPTYPMFYKKRQDLVRDYDRALSQMMSDGTYRKLEQTYFGEDITRLVQ